MANAQLDHQFYGWFSEKHEIDDGTLQLYGRVEALLVEITCYSEANFCHQAISRFDVPGILSAIAIKRQESGLRA